MKIAVQFFFLDSASPTKMHQLHQTLTYIHLDNFIKPWYAYMYTTSYYKIHFDKETLLHWKEHLVNYHHPFKLLQLPEICVSAPSDTKMLILYFLNECLIFISMKSSPLDPGYISNSVHIRDDYREMGFIWINLT